MATPKPSVPIAQALLAGLLQRFGSRYLDADMIAAGERLATRITKGDQQDGQLRDNS
jgi:hypothetical protein